MAETPEYSEAAQAFRATHTVKTIRPPLSGFLLACSKLAVARQNRHSSLNVAGFEEPC